MKRTLSIAAPIALIAVLLSVWEAACRLMAIPVFLLPPPSAIGVALAQRSKRVASNSGERAR